MSEIDRRLFIGRLITTGVTASLPGNGLPVPSLGELKAPETTKLSNLSAICSALKLRTEDFKHILFCRSSPIFCSNAEVVDETVDVEARKQLFVEESEKDFLPFAQDIDLILKRLRDQPAVVSYLSQYAIEMDQLCKERKRLYLEVCDNLADLSRVGDRHAGIYEWELKNFKQAMTPNFFNVRIFLGGHPGSIADFIGEFEDPNKAMVDQEVLQLLDQKDENLISATKTRVQKMAESLQLDADSVQALNGLFENWELAFEADTFQGYVKELLENDYLEAMRLHIRGEAKQHFERYTHLKQLDSSGYFSDLLDTDLEMEDNELEFLSWYGPFIDRAAFR